MNSSPGEEFVSTIEAAKMLGVTVRTVQIWVDSGKLDAKRTLGGHRRIPKSDVEKLVREKSFRSAFQAGLGLDDSRDQSLTVLAVDDDPTLLRLYEFKLKQFSVPNRLIKAPDGLQGMLMLGLHMPDLLLLDLEMPGMNGFDLMRTMQQMPEFAAVRIVVVSCMTAGEIIQHGGLPPGVSFIPKPVSFDAIETIFAQRAAELGIELRVASNSRKDTA